MTSFTKISMDRTAQTYAGLGKRASSSRRASAAESRDRLMATRMVTSKKHPGLRSSSIRPGCPTPVGQWQVLV